MAYGFSCVNGVFINEATDINKPNLIWVTSVCGPKSVSYLISDCATAVRIVRSEIVDFSTSHSSALVRIACRRHSVLAPQKL